MQPTARDSFGVDSLLWARKRVSVLWPIIAHPPAVHAKHQAVARHCRSICQSRQVTACANHHRYYSSASDIPLRPSRILPLLIACHCHALCPRRAIIRARWSRTGTRYDPIHSLGPSRLSSLMPDVCLSLSTVLTWASCRCRLRGSLCLVPHLMHRRLQ